MSSGSFGFRRLPRERSFGIPVATICMSTVTNRHKLAHFFLVEHSYQKITGFAAWKTPIAHHSAVTGCHSVHKQCKDPIKSRVSSDKEIHSCPTSARCLFYPAARPANGPVLAMTFCRPERLPFSWIIRLCTFLSAIYRQVQTRTII